MTKSRLTLLVLSLAIVSLALSYGAYRLTHSTTPLPPIPVAGIGSQRPDFSFPDTAGNLREASEWQGKVMLINFWATWCPPCRREIPDLLKLCHRYRDQGLVIVGIGVDHPDSVRRFVADLSMDYPNLLGGEAGTGLSMRYGNRTAALPYSVIVDRTGKIIQTYVGALKESVAERTIQPLLSN